MALDSGVPAGMTTKQVSSRQGLPETSHRDVGHQRGSPSVALDSGIPAGMTALPSSPLDSGIQSQGRGTPARLPSVALDSGVPAGMTTKQVSSRQGLPGTSHRDVGHQRGSPSLALDSGVPSGMTTKQVSSPLDRGIQAATCYRPGIRKPASSTCTTYSGEYSVRARRRRPKASSSSSDFRQLSCAKVSRQQWLTEPCRLVDAL